MNKPFLRRRLAVAIGSASLLLPVFSGISVSAQAQAMLDEVVVTARKQSENLQDTPVAVTALSGEALKDAGYTNLSSLSESTPGLVLDSGAGTGGAAAPYIRGIGQRDTNETLESGVAIYLDGVYQGRPDGALMDMVDVAAVQVLRGPQGTLFGKNSTGGAMLVDTNRPTDVFEGDLTLRAGNYGRRDAQLTVNVPLTDTLYSRFSFSSVRRDGYTKQLDPATNKTIDHWDDEDRLTAQAQLRWLANETVTVDLNATWGKQRETGRGARCTYVADQPGIAGLLGNLGQPALPFTIGLVAPGSDYKARCLAQAALDEGEFYASQSGAYENDMASLSLTVDWDIGEWAGLQDVSFKSITAWRKVDTIQNQEIDGTELPLIDRDWAQPRQSDQYSQEFQLNWKALDGRLTGVSGLFLYKEETVNGLQNSWVGPFTLPQGTLVTSNIANQAVLDYYQFYDPTYNIPGFINGPGYAGVDPTNILASQADANAILMGLIGGGAMPTSFLEQDYHSVWYANRAQKLDTSTETAALFTQVTYEVNDIVSVTAGLRYNWERKGLEADFFENSVNAGSGILETSDYMPQLAAWGAYELEVDTSHADYLTWQASGNPPSEIPTTAIRVKLDDNGQPIPLESLQQLLACVRQCDISGAIPGLNPGFTIGQLIPGGTGFFIPTALAATPEEAVAYLQANSQLKYLGTRKERRIDRSWTPMINIKFNGTDDFLDALNLDSGMAYFTYSRGFKSGGIVPASILNLQHYEPEKVDNYEVGFKFEALDRRLRYNAAFFYMDYQDIQVTVAEADPFNPIDVGILQSNAGVAVMKGFESELTLMPIEGLVLQFNFTYTDTEYKEFEYSYVTGLGEKTILDRANPCSDWKLVTKTGTQTLSYSDPSHPMRAAGLSCTPEKMPFVPEWTVFLAAQYSFFGDFGALTPRIEASYKSKQQGHFDFVSYQSGAWEIPEHTLYNARLSWELPDDRTRLTAWVKNIENKRVYPGVTPIPEVLGGGSHGISAPRTYGVDFSYRF